MIDRVYGESRVGDAVAQEIIATPTFQRLRGVDQAGFQHAFTPDYVFSRYEHSLGAYLLLDRFDASRDEKVAGLIHDLSHTAFSHCTEYAIEHSGDITKMEFQDSLHEDYVLSSEIPEIVERHGLDIIYLLDEHNFPLQEQNLPKLCADRMDYSYRGGRLTGIIEPKKMSEMLYNLRVIDNNWVYTNSEDARFHAEAVFKKQNDIYWCADTTAVMFYSVGEFLKRSFELELIKPSEMHVTDVEILQQTVPHIHKDPELARHWLRMNNHVAYHVDPDDYETAIQVKSRAIDPACLQNDELVPLSQTEGNEDWADIIATDLQPKTFHLRFDD